MGIHGYKHFMVPFIWLTRFLLNYFMHTRIMYHALHASGLTDRYIIQDIAQKYKGASAPIKAALALKIQRGGVGAWGAVPMPANQKVSPSEAQELVNWVLGTSSNTEISK